MTARAALLFVLATAPAAGLALLARPPSAENHKYYWPEPRGRPESYSVSPYTAPRRLDTHTLAWSWSNGGPLQKYARAAHSGLVIDDEESLYLSSTDGIRKFGSDGALLWHSSLTTWRIPVLSEGKVYVTDNNGTVLALSMLNGHPLWSAHFTQSLGTDISGLLVCDGVLLTEGAGNPGGGAAKVMGLNATDGRTLWEVGVDSQLWNFMPMDTGNGTFIFQDQIGGVYHHAIRDGARLWKAGYSGSWAADMTDGLSTVAGGVVYAVHSDGPCCGSHQKSTLSAYELTTGRNLWRQHFPYPANSQPAVGHVGKGAGLSDGLVAVMPIGAQPTGKFDAFPSAIRAFDAKTGEPVWEWTPPVWRNAFVAGDFQRVLHGTMCLPNPYGSPSIDARGTVYVGHFNGMIYAIRDDNGDGAIQDSEVSEFDAGAGFSHGGAAIAPGMLAIPSCDTLFVFKE